MTMAKSVIITAHGKIDSNPSHQFTLPVNLITTCKFGETHSARHLKFNELSIFTNPSPSFLYEHLLHSNEDYTNRGDLMPKGTQIPNILLSPCTKDQSAKSWSWQRPYVENHFRKVCIYELKDIPANKGIVA